MNERKHECVYHAYTISLYLERSTLSCWHVILSVRKKEGRIKRHQHPEFIGGGDVDDDELDLFSINGFGIVLECLVSKITLL